MNRTIASALLLVVLFGTASAGTVTLTGTCSLLNPNSTTLQFSLQNSGNDSAFNLIALPTIHGATPANVSYSMGNLTPNSKAVVNIGISNITEAGGHPTSIVVDYAQGDSYFSTIFPCLLYFLNTTTPQISLATYPAALQNGNATIPVVAVNTGPRVISANIFLALPQTFTYAGASFYNVTMQPGQQATLEFNVSLLSYSQANMQSYDVAAFAYYSLNGLAYATKQNFVISSAQTSTQSNGPILLMAALVVVVVVMALIVFSLLRKRKEA